MSLLTRLRRWIRSLFGARDTGDTEAETAALDAADTTEKAYVCAVCGTPVDSPETACPLCKSTDIQPADATESDTGDSGGLGPSVVQETRVTDDDGATTKLRELKDAGADPLDRHADKWEQLESGDRYRVTLADGSVTHADSKEQVRTALLRAYGHDAEGADDESPP